MPYFNLHIFLYIFIINWHDCVSWQSCRSREPTFVRDYDSHVSRDARASRSSMPKVKHRKEEEFSLCGHILWAIVNFPALFTSAADWCAICTNEIRLTTNKIKQQTNKQSEKRTKMDENQQKSTFFYYRLAIAVRFSVSNNRTDMKISESVRFVVSNNIAQGGKKSKKN